MSGSSGGERLLLGRYRLEEQLGEGALGTVVRAFDTHLKRVVAIKTVKRTDAEGREHSEPVHALTARFAREAEAGARMGNHPNLVTVYDLVAGADGTQYLILEYVAGGTLADRIQRGRLATPEALAMAADVAGGLQAAHDHGIVHRDVKPANIFLTADGRAKLGDFGVAQIDDLSRRTHPTTSHPGTPLYMSPELAASGGYARPSSDQYSLGLVLFEMLTGTAYKRLERPGADALLQAQPESVRVLVQRLSAEDPAARYPSMGEAAAAIRNLAMPHAQTTEDGAALTLPGTVGGGRPPPPSPPPVPPATAGRGRVSRRAFVLAGGGLVLAAGAATAYAISQRDSPTTARSLPPSTTTTATTETATTPSATVPATPSGTTAPSVETAPAATMVAAPVAPDQPRAILAYLDGPVVLPAEPRTDEDIIPGAPVTVAGVEIAQAKSTPLRAIYSPPESRAVRLLWAPEATRLATLLRRPTASGFSTSLDLYVIDVESGQGRTVADAINTLPAWSPDGTTLVYGKISGYEPYIGFDGQRVADSSGPAYDIHLVRYDGSDDRVIAHISPYFIGGRTAGCMDPIERLMQHDQFSYPSNQMLWLTDNSVIQVTLAFGTFLMEPDGANLRRSSELRADETTSGAYEPLNGVRLRLQDEADALQWIYEDGLSPRHVGDQFTDMQLAFCSTPATNPLGTTANAGHRNQIIAQLPGGEARQLTDSKTFKYHVTASPDGELIAFAAVTITDYERAFTGDFFEGYQVDVYAVPLAGGPEMQLSDSGAGHHPAWARSVALEPVKSRLSLDRATVRQMGYDPFFAGDSEEYERPLLRVLLGRDVADDGNSFAFFFVEDRYLGTDTAGPSGGVFVVDHDDSTVTLEYLLYRREDATGYAVGGQAQVRFHWNGDRLVALDPIPTDDPSAPLSRRPPVG